MSKASGLMANSLRYFVCDLNVSSPEVHVVSDQWRPRADSGDARGRVNSRLSEIRTPGFARSDLVANSFELTPAYCGKVFSFRSRGSFFVEIYRYAELAPQSLTTIASERNTVIHGNARNGHERNYISGAHSRVLAEVFVQINQFRSLPGTGDRGFDHAIGRSYKRDHRAVVVGVGLTIEQHCVGNRSDRSDYLIDDLC